MRPKRTAAEGLASPCKMLKTQDKKYTRRLVQDSSHDQRPLSNATSPSSSSLSSISRPPRENWKDVYDLIHIYRKSHSAPVDTMGCERLADPLASPPHQRFQHLIALMLSSQTKDHITAQAVQQLHQTYHPLSAETLVHAKDGELDKCIEKVGFHNKKTRSSSLSFSFIHVFMFIDM